jgi:hypothetical protein
MSVTWWLSGHGLEKIPQKNGGGCIAGGNAAAVGFQVSKMIGSVAWLILETAQIQLRANI